MISANRKLEFSDSALESYKVLLEQRFLLLDCTDLILQFHIFYLLKRKIFLQVVFNSERNIIAYRSRDNYLLVSLNLKNLPDFCGFVRQHVFKLFLLLTQHLHFTLVVGYVLVNGPNHVLQYDKREESVPPVVRVWP